MNETRTPTPGDGAAGAAETVTIQARYAGPPSSGNGGYTAGLLAELAGVTLSHPVTVTLRRPPPLDTTMQVERVDAAGSPDPDRVTVRLLDGDAVVAEAGPGVLAVDAVEPVSPAAAQEAEPSYRGLVEHPFPTCFVCGPGRDEGDGLRLSPGLVGPGRTACVWTPHPSLVTGETGVVPARFVWAALDCPGGWTSDLEARPLVLGRMTAACVAAVPVGRPYVVVGRFLREEGRKTFTATAAYDLDGRLVGRAEHTWIAVDPGQFA